MPFPLLKLDIIVDLGFRTDVGKGHWLRGGKLSDDALAFRIESEMVNTDSYVRQRNVLDEKQRRLLRWFVGWACPVIVQRTRKSTLRWRVSLKFS